MNRRELVNAIAAHTGLDRQTADAAVVSKGEPVAITGFAKFAKIERPARMGRNPATGEAIRIKASKKARITPLKAFKDAVMTPSLAPKLAKAGAAPASTRKVAAKKAPARTAAKKAVGRTVAKKAP